MISLLTQASLFPMQHATFTLPTLEAIATGDVQSWVDGTAATEQIHLKKTGKGTEDDEGGILDLNDVLQYGLANGFSEFIGQLSELNELLHGKTISDASVYITCGNTDGALYLTGHSVFSDLTRRGVESLPAVCRAGRDECPGGGVHLRFVAQLGQVKGCKVLPRQG